MIWGTWIDPNFKFKATDAQGEFYEFCCHADSEEVLRQRLTRKGLTVVSIVPYDFGEWKKRAREATDKVIWQRVKDRWSYFQVQVRERWGWLTEADLAVIAGRKKALAEAIREHESCLPEDAVCQIDQWTAALVEENPAPGQINPKTPIKFNPKLWGELKWHLFELFHGKCAYCENKPQAAHWGDVEHYRPKGKVDEDENHPGYYWLAYDQSNLLPACSLCNQAHAKMTHFPVLGPHARDPRNLAAERPLLLNPYDRQLNPLDHLEFAATGASQARNSSQHGENSRKFYHLDRPELSEARLEQMKLVEQDWNVHIGRLADIAGAWKALHQEIQEGKRPYAAAQYWELERLRRRTIERLMAAPNS